MDSSDPMVLQEPLEVRTPAGEVYRVALGPRGRGISVVALALPGGAPYGRGSGRRGRPANPGTVALRERLRKDAAQGELQSGRQYLDYFRRVDPRTSHATARQIVYREMRATQAEHPGLKVAAAPSGGGRASPALDALRQRLETDSKKGHLQDARHYVDLVLKQDKRLGLQRARQLVYRERRRVLA